LPNVTVGPRRALARVRAIAPRPSSVGRVIPGRHAIADRLRAGTSRERAVPLTVAGLVLVASLLSVAPASGIKGTGNADAQGGAPRIVAGGDVLGGEPMVDAPAPSALPPVLAAEQADAAAQSAADGGFLPDGTLLKPVAVDPTVPDAKAKLVDYYVQAGDTLTGIAHRFGISMMTLWWANSLTSKDQLHIGQHLVVPPVDGLVVTVKLGDTLDSIATAANSDPQTIADYNDLADDTVVVGQTLILPGAVGAGIPTPKPTATPKPAPKPATKTTTRSTTTVRSPSSYTGGKFYFPLPGHAISQYFHYGHPGIDIAGHTGDSVHAAAAGTVIYAGWRNNGGGLVVWISHGSGLYTTYNHMSAVLVHTGQRVTRGQIVGRVGATGWATGPHLHFEVWLNGVPGGVDRRVNPLRYF
jgi:murein DD-endopeptidase MepM/ murein hydrolase activator NlpD